MRLAKLLECPSGEFQGPISFSLSKNMMTTDSVLMFIPFLAPRMVSPHMALMMSPTLGIMSRPHVSS